MNEMNADMAAGIVEVAFSLWRAVTSHDSPDHTTIEDTLIQIAQATDRAYEQHTGEPLNPSLIHQEEPIE